LTYDQLTKEVLQLIDEYSRKGVALTVAKTADYRMKIPAAVNWVQQDLANSPKTRLHKDMTITNATATYPTETTQALPADWMKINKVMQLLSGVYWVPFADYYTTTASFIYNSVYAGAIKVSYYRKPTAIAVVDTSSPTAGELAQTIDVVTEAQYIVPIGVAGRILMADDNVNAMQLMNMYEAKKAEINSGSPHHGVETVHDAYGGL